ncbi:LysR substrate-binding domain-containing protein [Kitasatospora sp. NBC_01539]|uniref:LysR substrate-binding domain-containing protein n=1 Tax=Kitasatospora sp. NBC_01539 TaxID=2903577 RepID=UPI00386012CD
MPELHLLRHFLVVVEEGSVTRAAARLHLAQPALSRQLRRLEDELGVQLLERTSQGVRATPAGAVLAERGRVLCADADRLREDVRATARGEVGELDVGYGTSASYETAPLLLADFAERHPAVAVATRLLPAAGIVAGVADGSLDAGIVRCAPPTPDLVRTLVRREPQGVLVHAGHRLARTGTVGIADLAGETVLLHPREANPGHHDAITALFRDAGATPDLLVRRLAFDAAHLPVARGEAVSVVGGSALPGLPAGLVWIPLAGTPTIGIHLLTRARPGRRAVAALLRSAAGTARERGWLRP